jgi:biotin carboxyl carrier protein
MTDRDGTMRTDRAPDPRAIRVGLAGPSLHKDSGGPIVVEPAGGDGAIRVDGIPIVARLDRHESIHTVLTEGVDPPQRTSVLLLSADDSDGHTTRSSGGVRREVIVDGWRFEVEVDSERRAGLRERARRGHEDAASDGPTEVHAMIPGVVVSVSVVPGDAVVAGQQVLVVEAMKMQNEVRSPRDGVVGRLAVGTRQTIEVGDLLLVLE